ncbi:MAG TPA: NAD-dependent epimerase/dehydratase family protein [Vicinamibacteria bacterium]|nr:NAD-dependent epimerase/dehydratase family protein [Vicinamibacteria bacterium]
MGCRLAGGAAASNLLLGGRLLASPAAKRLLVVGGTDFLGPAVVEAGMVAGFRVSLFNRGVTNPGSFPFLERLQGYRSVDASDQNFTALAGRTWDAAIDVWPSDPTMVSSLAEFLKDRVGHYLYVSSCAAYDGFARPGLTEEAPLRAFQGSGPAYNREKAESERRLQQTLGRKLTIVRPGAIDGYRNDGANLQTWLTRVQTGGRHIGPGSGNEPIQVVDAKDVGRFLMLAIEQSLLGAFNLTGEASTFQAFLAGCRSATRSSAEFVWIPGEFLQKQDPDYGRFFPLWVSPTAQTMAGFFRISSEKAVRAGWRRRPFDETAADVLEWYRERDARLPTANGRAGHWSDPLGADKEAEIISQWKSLHS